MLLTWSSSQGLNALVNSAEFIAPLVTDVSLSRGTGSATFTRATVATVTDHEDVLRNCLSGEVRFQGARRVRNYVIASEDLMNANWAVSGTGVKVSATEFSFPDINGGVTHSFTVAVGDRVSFSVTLSGSGTITLVRANFGADLQVTLTATPQRFVIDGVATATGVGPYVYRRPGDTATSATIKYMQFENVTGQSIQTPGEYVSVGVLSSPFHGAMVDGVKYFATTNGNTVASNVVTEATGSPISSATLKGYQQEGARTNLCLQSNAFTTTWTETGTTTPTQNVVGPDGLTSAWTLTDNDALVNELVSQNITLTAVAHTASVFVKKTTGAQSSYPVIYAISGAVIAPVTVDTSNGIATAWSSYTALTIASGFSASIQNFSSGYWRVSLTFTGTVAVWALRLLPAGTTNATQSTGVVDVLAQGSAVFYGAQLEAGSFASTYIPTTTVAVPRNADVLTYPFAGNMSAITGTLYTEIAGANNTSIAKLMLGDGGSSLFSRNGGGANTPYMYDGAFRGPGPTVSSPTSVNKIAFSYGGVTSFCAVGGTVSANLGFDGDMSFTGLNMCIGGLAITGENSNFGTIRNVRIYSTQLSASQLQAVTA
jgi:hypothetical protein